MEQARSRIRDSTARMASEAGMAAGAMSRSSAEQPSRAGGADCDGNCNNGSLQYKLRVKAALKYHHLVV